MTSNVQFQLSLKTLKKPVGRCQRAGENYVEEPDLDEDESDDELVEDEGEEEEEEEVKEAVARKKRLFVHKIFVKRIVSPTLQDMIPKYDNGLQCVKSDLTCLLIFIDRNIKNLAMSVKDREEMWREFETITPISKTSLGSDTNKQDEQLPALVGDTNHPAEKEYKDSYRLKKYYNLVLPVV